MLLLIQTALSAPFLLPAGPETAIEVDRSGNWPRAVATEEGWSFFFGSGGDYWYVPLDDALVPDLARARALTGRADLVDHGIARCPDGGFLHAASYTVNQPDDSVAVYSYGPDLALREEAVVVEGAAQVITRDMPVVCGETFRGLGLFDMAEGTTFAEVQAGEPTGEVVLDDAPMMTGSGWAEGAGSLWTVGHGIQEWGDVRLRGYDADFQLHTSSDLALVSAPLEAYWSQGFLQVGEFSVLAFMARDEAAGWQLQDGDVWLAVFDAGWNLVETLQVTTNTPPIGAMQPGLAIKDDTLLVTYVRDMQPYAVEVPFDPEAAITDGVDGEDPAGADPVGTDEAIGGCARGGEGAAFLLLPLAFRVRRRGATVARLAVGPAATGRSAPD